MNAALEFALRLFVFAAGLLLVLMALFSAIRTFVLPRTARDPITRWVFRRMRRFFDLFVNRKPTYEYRDQIMAMYAPVTLLMLPVVWLGLAALGYTLMFWALGISDPVAAFKLSGSSLLTLGIANPESLPMMVLTFSEATVGLVLIALLIAYLPTMYAAFSAREALVALMEVRAGAPPSAVTLLARNYSINGFGATLTTLWADWERWFVMVEETHTSLAALVFFRSPMPDHSWITAAGAILDAASLYDSTVDEPRDPQANLTIRAGYVCLRRICDFFRIEYNADPAPTDPISITQAEFDAVYDDLKAQGVPVKPDRQQAWRDYAGWRVNYDVPLLALAALTMAPYAQWISDRSLQPRYDPTHIIERAGTATPMMPRQWTHLQ